MRDSAWSSVIIASKAVAFSMQSSIISSMEMVRREVLGDVLTIFFAAGLSSEVLGVPPAAFSSDGCLASSAAGVLAVGAASSSSVTVDAPPNRLLFASHASSSVSITYSKDFRNSSWDNRVYLTKDVVTL